MDLMTISDPKFNLLVKGLKLINWKLKGSLMVPADNIESDPADRSIISYADYEDIFNDNQNSIDILVSEALVFDSTDLIQTLAKINYLLATDYAGDGLSQEDLIRDLVPTTFRSNYLKFIKSNKQHVFFFRLQLLSLIKLIASKGSHSGILTREGRDIIHRLLLRMSGILANGYAGGKGEIGSENEKPLIAQLMRDSIINSTEQFRYKLPRFWLIFSKYFDKVKTKFSQEFFDIKKAFHGVTSIDSEIFTSIVFGVWAMYNQEKHHELLKTPQKFLIGPQVFKNVKQQVQADVKKSFAYLGATLEEHLEKIGKGFDSFLHYPFVKVNENGYFPIDMNFIEDKVSNGIFTVVEKSLLENNRTQDRNQLRSTLGRAVGFYVDDLFQRIKAAYPKIEVYLESDYGIKTQGPDIIVVEGETLFFFEVAVATLQKDELLSADYPLLEKRIKTAFFREEKESAHGRGRIDKFCSAIDAAKNAKFSIRGLQGRRFRTIFPVLVLQEQLPFIGRKLVNEIIGKKNPPHMDILNHIEFIDLEELEMLEAEIEETKCSIADMWQQKLTSAYRTLPLKNYLLFKRKTVARNQFLRKTKFEIVNPKMKENLFDVKGDIIESI